MVVGSSGVGPCRQREDGEPRLRRIQRLVGEHRQVLRDVVAEGDAEHADVVGAAVAGADDGLRVQLVGDADARREVGQRGLDVAVHADAVLAGDHDFAGGEVLEAAVVLAVDVLREVDLPAQADVHGELRRDLPGVLHVGEEAVLPFGGLGGVADVAGERVHLAEQERCQAEAAAVRTLRGGRVEGELAGAVRVAGHAQVLLVAPVDAELERVVADDVGGVADPLEFVLLLVQRAVAAIDAQRVAEVETAGAVQGEVRACRRCSRCRGSGRGCRRPWRARCRRRWD